MQGQRINMIEKAGKIRLDKRTIIAEVLAALILLGSLSSCSGDNRSTSNAFVDPKTRWLAGDPCAPPCWENIEPGIARPEKIVEILKASPSVEPASIQVTEFPDDDGGFTVWTFSSVAATWTGRIGNFSDGKQTITLNVPDLCLNEIINAYGEPDYLLSPEKYRDLGEINLIWESQGFLYETNKNPADDAITGNVCGGELTLFPIGTPFEEIPSRYQFSLDRKIVPWTGYGRYSE